MATSLAERSRPGKITRNRSIKQSRASGFVARRHTLPEYLEPGEVDIMLRSAPHGEARLLSLIQWRAGLRISEAMDLEVKDLMLSDVENPTIRVRYGKGERARLIPTHPELTMALVSFLAYSAVRKGPLLPVPSLHGLEVAPGGSKHCARARFVAGPSCHYPHLPSLCRPPLAGQRSAHQTS